MRRTSPAALIGVAVLGGVVGWLLQIGLVSSGAASFIPPVTLYTALVVLAIALVLLGRPVRRTVRGTAQRPVDPFFAMRVLVLAKASSLAGALLVGAALALLIFGATRTGTPFTPAFWPDVLTGVAALLLVIAGVLVEWWCRIPPEDRDREVRRAVESQ